MDIRGGILLGPLGAVAGVDAGADRGARAGADESGALVSQRRDCACADDGAELGDEAEEEEPSTRHSAAQKSSARTQSSRAVAPAHVSRCTSCR